MVTICRVKNRLKVTFSYSPDLVKKIKTVPGHCWHPKERCWTISDTKEAIHQFFRVFSQEKVKVERSLLPVARMYLHYLPAPSNSPHISKNNPLQRTSFHPNLAFGLSGILSFPPVGKEFAEYHIYFEIGPIIAPLSL